MRIGLIGVGRIGAFHARTLRGLPGVGSVVVADADAARAREAAGRLGIESVAAADLLTAGIDALVIATSTGTHPALIVRGVAAGLPVFCEKPVAADVAGTLEVIRAVDGAADRVQVGFQRRFDAGFQAAREAARTGALGWLHTVRSMTCDAAPPPAAYTVIRRDLPGLRGPRLRRDPLGDRPGGGPGLCGGRQPGRGVLPRGR